MAGTMRKISSTVCDSISDAFSCDFNGFKYFCVNDNIKDEKKRENGKWKKENDNKHSIY